jgi:predicted permease
MSAIRGLVHRVRVLVDPDGYAREVEREIRFHLDREAMQARSGGAEPVEADYAARRRFGNVTNVREEVRRMSGVELLDRIKQNLSYAWRGLSQSSGFTAAVVLTLALGLGVNAAMFTFLDRVFVKPPAGVANPGEVRRLYAGLVRDDQPNSRMYVPRLWISQLKEIARADSTTVLGLAQYSMETVNVAVGASSFPAQQGLANTSYFHVLGVRPQLGRFFDSSEDRVETAVPVAVITHAMWKNRFNGDEGVIGTTFKVNHRPFKVVGVTPPGFAGIELNRSDFWIPISHGGSGFVNKIPWYETYQGDYSVIARLPTAESERRFLEIASRGAAVAKIAFWGDSTADVVAGPIQFSLGPAERASEVSIALRLGGVALIVLLITVANVSNLLLVRATRREREIAIRRALGVTRGRLLGQLLTESVLLAAIGGAVAIMLAVWVGAALRSLLLPDVSWPTGVLDLRVASFAFATALATGIIIGLVPGVHVWRPNVLASLRNGGRSGVYRKSRLRTGLLVAQAALSVVLLAGSGLFVSSLRNVVGVDVGFDLERTTQVRIRADSGFLGPAVAENMPALIERLSAIPGVESVAGASALPMYGSSYPRDVALPGHDSLPIVHGKRWAGVKYVSHGALRTLGIRLIAGRDFRANDAPSVVVDEAVANAYWPGRSPLGQCLVVTKEAGCLPVIGVAAETHARDIINDEAEGAFYTNLDPKELDFLILRATPEVRKRIAPVVAAEVKRLIPRAATVELRSMDDLFESELRPWRLGATLFTAMGVLALVVSAIGVYSVIAYATSQRASEMGVRIALGARVTDIAKLVISDGFRTVVLGVLVGIALAVAAGKLVASLLYGISPRDPVILAGAGVLLAVIGVIACVVPAVRASRVDPVSSLRVD